MVSNAQQGFPQVETAFVEADEEGRTTGRLTETWRRFLITLWQRSGSGNVPTQDAVVLVNTGSGIEAFDALSGTSLGALVLTTGAGAAVPVVITGSPQTYVASEPGVLVVFGAMVEISRDAGVIYYKASLSGGSFPLAAADRARITWFTADDPEVTFFKDLA